MSIGKLHLVAMFMNDRGVSSYAISSCIMERKIIAPEMKMEQYAYIRVSTKEQHIDRRSCIKTYSIHQKIFIAISIRKDFERP